MQNRGWAVGLLVLASGWALPAGAQGIPGGQGSHVLTTLGDGGAANRARRQREAGPTPPPAPTRQPEIWPRLDAGAVLCQSRDELVARARMLEDAGRGGAELPQGCHLVRGVTGVTVVDRVPPGATQVKLTGSGETGWTDAYLPDRRPGG